MPAITMDAEGRRPVKEQSVCPSALEGRETREMMVFPSELRGNVPAG